MRWYERQLSGPEIPQMTPGISNVFYDAPNEEHGLIISSFSFEGVRYRTLKSALSSHITLGPNNEIIEHTEVREVTHIGAGNNIRFAILKGKKFAEGWRIFLIATSLTEEEIKEDLKKTPDYQFFREYLGLEEITA